MDKIGEKKENKVDIFLLVITFLLLAFGLMMLYSASSYSSLVNYHTPYFYLLSQLKNLIFGLAFGAIAAFIPYRLWSSSKVAIVVYIISIVMVILVKTSLGKTVKGASRWINVLGFSFQPAEAVKVAVIIATAMMIYWNRDKLYDIKEYFKILVMIIIPTILIAWITDDLGSAVIVFAIGFIMLIISCPNKLYTIFTAVGIIGCGVVFIIIEPFRQARISAWLHLEENASDASYQVVQALYAIGSGGFFGKGLGKSTQKLGFIPETQNDMIFSVICEELGIIGGIALLFLFVLLLWRMWKIYITTEDIFGRLIVSGVMTHIGLQTIINTAVVTSLIPNTGVPLLFISYGGSSIMMALIEVGLVTSVSLGIRGNRKNKHSDNKKGVIKYTKA